MRAAAVAIATFLSIYSGTGYAGCPQGHRASNESGMPAWFCFTPAETIQRWIDEQDDPSIRSHALYLWAALTSIDTMTGRAIFESWSTKEYVFGTGSAGDGRLSAPAQLTLSQPFSSFSDPSDTGIVFTRVFYNEVMNNHVKKHSLADPVQLRSRLTSSGNFPIAQRTIPDFPSTSIMVKAAYQIVSHTRVTKLPVWWGPRFSTQPSTPGPTTWSRFIEVIPIDDAQGSGTDTITIKDFNSFVLNDGDIQRLRAEFGVFHAAVGDHAVLVGMHIATKEIVNWTWQTFWWSLKRPSVMEQLPSEGKIEPPFDHFEFAAGYEFLQPPGNENGLPSRTFNPYLEAEFGETAFSLPGQRGIESNCISCHRAAVWPVKTAKFVANGLVSPDDPFFFADNLKADYVWGISSVEDK